MHGGQDVALEGAREGQPPRRVEPLIGELGGTTDIGELGRALHQTQAADQVGGVLEGAKALERGVEALGVAPGEAVGLVLDAEPRAPGAALLEDGAERLGRVRALLVDPDADVLDDRGVARLAQVRGPGEQGEGAVGAEVETLEEDVVEGVVAGEVIHALLAEHQQAIEAPRRHRRQRRLAALGELLGGEMKRHVVPTPLAMADGGSPRRPRTPA